MGFFDDDPFEDIMREFFGGSNVSPNNSGRRVSRDSDMISGEEEERNIDFVETSTQFFVVFELPGYDKSDIKIDVSKNKLTVNARKKPTEKVQDYLSAKLANGVSVVKSLPNYIKTKNYNSSFSNGVLEVSFRK